MSIVLQRKHSNSSQVLGTVPAEKNETFLRSILLSSLLVTVVASAGVFSARLIGSFHLAESESLHLATIGATVCFTSLPLLLALYRRQQQAALIGGSVVLFSMVLLAGIIS